MIRIRRVDFGSDHKSGDGYECPNKVMKHVLFHGVGTMRGWLISEGGRVDELKSSGLFFSMFAELFGHVLALPWQLLELGFVGNKGVKKTIKVTEGLAPAAGNNVEGQFATMVSGRGGGSVLEKNFDDFATAHEGRGVEGGVSVTVGLFDVRIVFEKQIDNFWMSVKRGAGEGSHTIFLMESIDTGSEF